MTITTYQAAVATTYGGHTLTALSDHATTLDPERYPLTWNESQFNAVRHKDRVFAILAKTSQTPSEKAGFALDGRCEVVIRIDESCRLSIANYVTRIRDAIRLDARRIAELEAIPTVEGYYGIEDYTINPTIALAYSIWRFFSGHATTVRTEGSAYRLACLTEIGALEEKRLSEMKTIIVESSKPLLTELGAKAAIGETDVLLLRSLRQLALIYLAEFGTALEVTSGDTTTHVTTYLEGMKTRHPALNFE